MMARAVLVAAAGVVACCAADLFPVAGVVMSTGTNAPLPRAHVYFYRSGTAKAVARTVAGDDGRFLFQLPAGTYRMLAGTRDTWENYGSRHPGNSLGSAVIVGAGKDTGSLVFRFFPPAAISGRVLDDSGQPVPNALVQLIRAYVVGGLRTPAVFGYERTNDLGEYRFGRLPGDSPYYLAVTGEPWYTQSGARDASATRTAYAPVYYPNVADPSKAASILIKPGEEARADFRLHTVANAEVKIVHNAPDGMKGTVSLSYDGVAGAPAFQQTQELEGFKPPIRGQEEPAKQVEVLGGVPPGHYKVTIIGTVGGNVFMADTPVDVNGADVTVDVALKPMLKLEGTVHLAPGVTQRGAIRVGITRDESGAGLTTAPVQGDGSFTFPSVAPGRFRVSLTGPDGFFVSRMTARGGTVQGGIVEVADGSDVALAITASNETGGLDGFAVDGDRPLEGVLVLLAPTSGQFLTDRPRVYQTESDGSFDFRLVPAGHYRLFAVDEAEFEYGRPEAVAPYLPRAREIEIRAGSAANERLPLTRR